MGQTTDEIFTKQIMSVCEQFEQEFNERFGMEGDTVANHLLFLETKVAQLVVLIVGLSAKITHHTEKVDDITRKFDNFAASMRTATGTDVFN